ncbi:DNA polymerase III subunit alpha [Anaerocolumna sedimenticola]|uniref:DNA polymerase III subunit alpha n=1 Tax=Anaerocolumna sedimenticola TaxID=2696063 RepID=A0A6P1THV2_9FIRM|nr:DNA polymerase III subunit alpha [Anaerocolumna sedimenticola]QHQ60724.1 DNA polymerase III subunit alpha [Anaerocolumna sedimenticola]
MNFTHLHLHTEYSLLDGSGKIKEMVARTKELGMDSMAITDHGVMYGVIDFYRACLAEGIQPVIGCEVYVAPGSRFDREANSSDDRYYHLVLLAENNTGYANLMKIVSKGFLEGFYYKPRVDYEVLKEYSEGIIALSACIGGEIASNIRKGFYEEAKKAALRLKDIFGENNFFLELQDHGIPEQKSVNQGLLRMSKETGIPLVATNDVHYTLESDAAAHDILLCIQTQKKVTDENRMRYEGGQYFIKSPEEMLKIFPYATEALENTHKIAERCHVEIEFGEYKLPKFDVPAGITALEYLKKLCYEGLNKRYPNPSQELIDRLDYEIETIRSMGFVDYFLIVGDFIKYARDHEIMVGPGRGSAAGSIVSYSLGITNIDPIKYNLLFERFLNPERLTMPDIDIDFCFERRQEVIDYVVEKYGKDRVVQIVTFGTMAARAVIRDVGRALDLGYGRVDTVAKMIPTELGITIEKALKLNPDLKTLYDNDDDIRNLIDMSKRLEGLPRHTSMHAAGVVISKAPVMEYVPLSRASDDSITTQFTMTTLEELGLLKMDFLGLRTLTVIQNAVRLINKRRNEGEKIDIDNIDYNDKNVYALFASAKTDGIFQFESAGMKNFLKELKPSNLEDIIAGNALYRPGPMDFIPKYIKGKNQAGSIIYECPQLEPILSPTYGCIVYQEQVMQIVRDLAGYSYGRSDLVRRAMSKKKASVMEKERYNFVYGNDEENVPGCIKNGISEEVANHIFDEMTDFAKYAFNKSHAAAYAVVAYQTAFLKCYYPVEFMAALMTSVIDNPGKVAEYIFTCRQMGIKILPPDINEGDSTFSVSEGAIRYGLSAIKGLGRPVIEAVVKERESNGKFTSLRDFAERLSGKEVNKRTVESFIKSGAFDSLQGTRKQLMMIYVQVLDDVAQTKKRNLSGQMSLFDFAEEEEKTEYENNLPDVGEYTIEQKLSFEKEVMGIYASGHPLEAYGELMKKNITATTMDFVIDEETNETKVNDGEMATVGGIITGKTVKTTRTNSMMAFVTLEDMVGAVEIIVFPKDYDKYKMLLVEDNKVLVRGKIAVEEEKNAKLICQTIIPFESIPKVIWIKYPNKEKFVEDEQRLYTILREYDGTDSVCIYLECEKAIKHLPKSMGIKAEIELIDKLKQTYSEANIKVIENSIEKARKID